MIVRKKLFILISVLTLLYPAQASNYTNVPGYLAGYEQLYEQNPRKAALKWFKEAEMGLFIHYGLVSLLPKSRDQWTDMERANKENEDFSLSRTLVNSFNAENFDADFITELAAAAGMKYINFTACHRGGLCLWNTETTDFTSLNSPANKDFIAELAQACRRRGLGLFIYVPANVSRTNGANKQRNHTILTELLTQYVPIAGIWFDSINAYYREPEKYEDLSQTYSLIRSLQPQCLISFKQGALGSEDFVACEHSRVPHAAGGKEAKRQWEKIFKYKPAEICTTLQTKAPSKYNKKVKWFNDVRAHHLDEQEVIELYKSIRAQEANMLLNIELRADGSVHPEDVKTLKAFGKLIAAN